MRRSIVVLAAAALLASLAEPAQAGGRRAAETREEYDSVSLYGNWVSRRPLPGKAYLRITWYADAYQSNEAFWSSIYRDTLRCMKRDGRDRCKFVSYESGSIREIEDGSFGVNPDLTAGVLDATYRIKFVDGKRVKHPETVRFVAYFDGSGETYRTTEAYSTYEDDCLLSEYSAEYTYRESDAWADLDGKSLGWTDSANVSRGHAVYIQYDCPEED